MSEFNHTGDKYLWVPVGDKDVSALVAKLFEEHQGEAPLEQFQLKFKKRFNCMLYRVVEQSDLERAAKDFKIIRRITGENCQYYPIKEDIVYRNGFFGCSR